MGIAEVVFGLIIFGIGGVGGVLYERRHWQKVTGFNQAELYERPKD